MSNLKKNLIYSTLLSVSGYIFPLITYPYITRTLGATGIGICDFVDSIINYFILFSMMGITACGIREIASCRDDKHKRSQVFCGVIALNAISTLIALAVLLTAMYTVDSLTPYRNLLYIGVCKLVMNLFLVEWLFSGMENFAYITKRTLVIKTLYVIGVFLLIKDKSDYAMYYVLTVGIVVVNALVNIIYARRFVSFEYKGITIKPFLKSFFYIGLYKIITSFYSSLNVAWLGFATCDEQVGYYTTSTRLYTIIIALFTACTNVMLPNMTSLLAEGKEEEFWKKIGISVECLLAFAFPTIVVAMAMGPTILHLLAGNGFEGAYLPFRIIVPLILIIGYEQVLVLQVLMPMKKDNVVLRNSVIGASLALCLNILIVGKLGATGSSIVWLCSEVSVLIATAWYATRKTEYRLPLRLITRYMLYYMPLLALFLILAKEIQMNEIAALIACGLLTLIYTIWLQTKVIRCGVVLECFGKVRVIMSKLRK